MDEGLQHANTITKGNTSKSPVWNYFKRVLIDGVYRAKCLQNGCTQTLSVPNWATSSLYKHLRSVHNIENLKKKINGRVIIGRVVHKLSKKHKKTLDHLAVQAIVKDGRSFNDFHKSGLKKFLQYAIPGYVPVHRNIVHHKLDKLYDYHHKLMVDKLSDVSDIAISIDFWSDKKIKSYLVLTGHFISKDFKSNSTILQFSSFDKRHYSNLIGEEIEKQLTELKIFHKITTITCDNAPNMLGLFRYLSRDIKHIPCMAHILHLIICNGLGIWQGVEDGDSKKSDKSINSTNENENDFDEGLSQSVRTMNIGGVGNKPVQHNNQQSEEGNESGGDTGDDDDDDETFDGDDESEMMTTDSSDVSDVEMDVIEDNFQIGLITNENDAQERTSATTEKQIIDVLRRCRRLVSTIKYSNVFQLFLKDLINEYNNANEMKIKRALQLDVKSRWSSTHYMLESVVTFRPVIDSLFKNIRKMNVSKKQAKNLTALEMSNTCWEIIELLIKVLEPFRHAIQLISGTQYPTVGLTLFVLRKIEQNFLEMVRPDDNEILQKMKQLIHEKLLYYTTTNQYNEGFINLIVHAYFDPYGLSVLSQKEIASIERRLKNLTHQSSDEQQQQFAMISTKQKLTTLDKFLDSIDIDNNCVQHSTNRASTSTSTLANETKKYRQLATSFISDGGKDKNALFFWKCNEHLLPSLSMLARKYLATPATSVPSESAFSKSAYYGRKERASLQGDKLSQSVFLKDKLIPEK